MPIILNNGWLIQTAWAQHCKGHGWVNDVIWVLVQRQGTNELRIECVQPEDQTEEMRVLAGISEVCSDSMAQTVIGLMSRRLVGK